MRKLNARILAVPFALLLITGAFQNCAGGFSYDPGSGNLASSTDDLTGVFGLKAYNAGGTAMSDSLPFDPGVAYELRATGSNSATGLLTWSMDPASTASCILNSSGVVNKREIKCTTPGIATVKLQAIMPDETVSYASLTHSVGAAVATPTPGPGPGPLANTVDFRIRAGTGAGAWNTAAAPIVVFVGQNLRFFNDDTVPHRMHTNGVPFPHWPADVAPNANVTEVITAAHAANAGDLYDHDVGTAAAVYIVAVDGAMAYAKVSGPGSCAGCHGALANSQKSGSTFTSIKAAIAGNRGGMGGIVLTDNEIAAIAYSLSKK